jgi:predicted alpha/beta hydrolase
VGGPASNALQQLVLICPHTGFHDDYGFWLRLAVRICWRVLGPPLRATLGYFPANRLGFGEDLPDRIALQWAARSKAAFALGLKNGDATREQRILENVKRLRVPALIVSVEDDTWATENGVRRVLQIYRGLLLIRRTIKKSPKDRRLGHSGFFRRSQRTRHWAAIVRFLLERQDSLPACTAFQRAEVQ